MPYLDQMKKVTEKLYNTSYKFIQLTKPKKKSHVLVYMCVFFILFRQFSTDFLP